MVTGSVSPVIVATVAVTEVLGDPLLPRAFSLIADGLREDGNPSLRYITLIREGNSAAAISLGGVMLGLAIPLAVSLHASTSMIEIGIWGASTVAVQLLVFRLVDLVLHGLPQRIQAGEVSAAALLVGAKLATALILAAAVAG